MQKLGGRPDSPIWSAFVLWGTGMLVVALALAAWQAMPAILIAFASMIFAIVLLAVARPIERFLGLPRGLSLPIAGLAVLSVPVIAAVVVGPELSHQLQQVGRALPSAVETIERRFDIDVEAILRDVTGTGEQGQNNRNLLSDAIAFIRTALINLGTAGSYLLSGLAGLLVVLAGGFYLALDPERYRRGLVLLFPVNRQDQIEDALSSCGIALDKWLKGQLIAMTAVGLLTGLGAWAIGLPASLALGVIAGILEFIPIIGPWVSAVPVMILAISQGPQMILLAALLLIAVQQLESNVITPIAQQRMAEIPPFLVLFGLIGLGLLFGLIGVVVAGPLTLVAYVLVTELYVRDTLGQDVEIPGQPKEEEETPSA